MIIEVKAKFACDDCGTEFFVPLDHAYEFPQGWSVFEAAEDAIRGGIGYEDATENTQPAYAGCVDGCRHYCAACTRKIDATTSVNTTEVTNEKGGE